MKDVSHIHPVSTHPEMANDPDNIVWEDSDVNRARGAQVMTETEILPQLMVSSMPGPSMVLYLMYLIQTGLSMPID